MPDHSYIDDFVEQIKSNAFKNFGINTIGKQKQISTIYYSVPKSVMLDERYLSAIS